MSRAHTILLLFLPGLALSKTFLHHPYVSIPGGASYQGVWINGTSTYPFASFQGIRYAQPPTGDLRFTSPKPYFENDGAIIDVSGESKVMCPQMELAANGSGIEIKGQEDCLVLNIYVPNSMYNAVETRAPVMVFIHGGGLQAGGNLYADYGPQHFMDYEQHKNVILVVINYRLGPLGFLSMGSEEVPGNAGMRDQVMALKWIQDHIDYFFGDPDSVTIFGQSGGSLAVAAQLISPLSNNLFHRAILQSGSALDSGWGPITPEHAIDYKNKFSNILGCSKSDNELRCLQEKSVDEIILLDDLQNGPIVWMIVPDAQFSPDPFLPGDPEEIMLSGQFNTEIEVIIGHNRDESLITLLPYVVDPSLLEGLKENFDTIVTRFIFNIANESDITDNDRSNARQLLSYYTGSDSLDALNIKALVDLYTDSWFAYGHHKTVDRLTMHGVPVFQYFFAYEGEFSFIDTFVNGSYGVCHGDELIYMWEPFYSHNGDLGLGPLKGDDLVMRKLLMSAWTNFATYGDPTPPDSGLSWLPQSFSSEHLFWYISSLQPTMNTSQNIKERWTLWSDMFGT